MQAGADLRASVPLSECTSAIIRIYKDKALRIICSSLHILVPSALNLLTTETRPQKCGVPSKGKILLELQLDSRKVSFTLGCSEVAFMKSFSRGVDTLLTLAEYRSYVGSSNAPWTASCLEPRRSSPRVVTYLSSQRRRWTGHAKSFRSWIRIRAAR